MMVSDDNYKLAAILLNRKELALLGTIAKITLCITKSYGCIAANAGHHRKNGKKCDLGLRRND